MQCVICGQTISEGRLCPECLAKPIEWLPLCKGELTFFHRHGVNTIADAIHWVHTTKNIGRKTTRSLRYELEDLGIIERSW